MSDLSGLSALEYAEGGGRSSRKTRAAIALVAVVSVAGVALGALHVVGENQAHAVRQRVATACGVELWRVAAAGYATDEGTRYDVDIRGLDAPGTVAWALIASDDAPIDCQIR